MRGELTGMIFHSSNEILKHADFDLFSSRGFVEQIEAEHVVVLIHSHCLKSTYSLLRELVSTAEIPAQNIIFLPKPYSTIPSTIQRITALGIRILTPSLEIRRACDTARGYDRAMRPFVAEICSQGQTLATNLSHRNGKARVILIDDGGILTRQWSKDPKRRSSFETISIQQTRSGTNVLGTSPPLPVINVAQSAAKRKFESHVIADAIVEKTRRLNLIDQSKSIGVFGLGMIGRAIAKKLLDQGIEIQVCDERALKYDNDLDYWNELKEASTRKNFVNSCDIIFGTTSADWFQDYLVPRHRISREKILISCSSRDREFRNILSQPRAFRENGDDRYSDVLWYPIAGQRPLRVLNGGFPINFDRWVEWERPEEIALTRVLILAAVLQGMCTDLASTPPQYIQLDPHIQRYLTQRWMQLCNKRAEDFCLPEWRLDDVNWWARESMGNQPIARRVVRLADYRTKPTTSKHAAPREVAFNMLGKCTVQGDAFAQGAF